MKKKAWLLVWAPVPMCEGAEIARMDFLRRFAEETGYEVIGKSEVIGRGDIVEDAIMKLLAAEPPANGADAIYLRGLKVIALNGYVKAIELCDKAKERGVEVITADGSLQMIRDNYEFYMPILKSMDEAQKEIEDFSFEKIFNQMM